MRRTIPGKRNIRLLYTPKHAYTAIKIAAEYGSNSLSVEWGLSTGERGREWRSGTLLVPVW